MAGQLSTKVKLYAKSKGKENLDFSKNVLLQDDMIDGVSNPYIKEWNVDGVAKPSQAELDAFETEAETEEYNQGQIAKRLEAYNSQNQMENIIENGLDVEKKRVEDIKKLYPKK